jgi:hypothetical protein
MKTGKAFAAGVVGALAMTILTALARMMGMPVNLEMMLGTMFGAEPGGGAWMLGLVMHLIISGLIALLYGLGFEHVTHRAGAGVGVAFSIVHIVIGGFVMAMIPIIHPLVPETMNAPGAFMSNMGMMGVAAFVIEHLIFGAIVGAIYGTVLHPRHHAQPALAS